MYEIINNKKRGKTLTNDEINFVVQGFTTGEVPDYQMSALLMAIYFQGMSPEETAALTMAMANSGEQIDLSNLHGKNVDKHSTGGVGDKTTLIVAPIVAALGLNIPKMSGRGLGHTGGTIDKIESIPGVRTSLESEEFLKIVNHHKICITGQSANLAPADKAIYALRDVTATVDSIPLIAASIMSKKIAAGAKYILLDVKTGSGAFMKDVEDATKLAQEMVNIGGACGRETAAIITDMSAPLGWAVGNSLEVIEAIEVLSDKASDKPLAEVCITLAAHLLHLAAEGDFAECRQKVEDAIKSGIALQKFAEMIEAQGGDPSYILNPENFPKAAHIIPCPAPETGYITKMDTEGIGLAAVTLGAGRSIPTDTIDHSAGIVLHAKTGNYVEKGQPLATLHTNNPEAAKEAKAKLIASYKISSNKPRPTPLIHAQISLATKG